MQKGYTVDTKSEVVINAHILKYLRRNRIDFNNFPYKSTHLQHNLYIEQ